MRALAVTLALTSPVALLRDVFGPGPIRSELQVVQPATLAPAGPPVRLEGFMRGWTRSPDGQRLALGVGDRRRIQIVDLRAGRTRHVLRSGRRGSFWLLRWPRPRRLLAVGYGDGASLLVVDPVRGHVLRRLRVGAFDASAPTADGLALLAAPRTKLAAATLVLVDAEGGRRGIPLPGILAGTDRARSLSPGLAVRGPTAYVASATEPSILAVDLASGRTVSHPLAAAAAKDEDASGRTLAFVGPHELALSGTDSHAGAVRGVGLRLVDTRTWRSRVVAPEVRGFTALPGGGLAYLERADPPFGLVLDTDRRSVFARPVVQLQYASHYAYAVTYRPRHHTFVIDLRTGRVVHRLPTAQPGLVLG